MVLSLVPNLFVLLTSLKELLKAGLFLLLGLLPYLELCYHHVPELYDALLESHLDELRLVFISFIEHDSIWENLLRLRLPQLKPVSQLLLLLFVQKMPSFKFSLMSVFMHLFLYSLPLLHKVFQG